MSSKSFKVKNSLGITPNANAGTEAGELRVDSSDSNKLKFHNGTTEKPVVTSANSLVTSKAAQTDSNGDLQSSAVTSTELGYVAGVTSAIQTQLNSKGPSALANGTNLFNFVFLTASSVTVHTGDVYTDGTVNFTVQANGTGVTSVSAVGTARPADNVETLTKSSGNAGSTASFLILNYVDNLTPSFGFSAEAGSGVYRLGTNDWGLALNGQTMLEFGTRTVGGVTGNVIGMGSAQAIASDPDTILQVSGYLVDPLKFNFANRNTTDSSTGAILSVQVGNTPTQITLENWQYNTETNPYMSGGGGLFTSPDMDFLVIGAENDHYVITLSSPASITAGTTYTNNGNTYVVSTTSSSSTTLNVTGPGNPTASGTLVFVSGSPSGNKSFDSFTASGYIAHTVGGRISGNEVFRMTSSVVGTSNQLPFQTGDGSALVNGFGFAAEPDTGWSRTGSLNPTLNVNAVPAIDVKFIGGGSPRQINFGLGTTTRATADGPLYAITSYNGTANWQFGNVNTGSSTGTALLVQNGLDSNNVNAGIINAAYGSQTYYGGGSVFFADAQNSFLKIASEYSAGHIGFNVAGLTSATERLRITTTGIQSQNSTPFLMSNGAVGTPGLAFTSETNSGLYRLGSHDIGLAVNGTLAIEVNEISSTQMNIGLGGPASASVGTPLSAAYTYAGAANFNYSNLSQNSAASTVFYIGAGASGGNGITVENLAYSGASYVGGGGLVSAGPNLSFLNICAENTGAYMAFNVGGRTPATEAMRLGLTGSGLTINKGWNLVLSGSSSGAVSIDASSGTYNFNLPTTAGSSGQALLSGGGGAGAMTWGSVLTNPMTTLGDMLIGGASGVPARVAVGTNGQVWAADSTATDGMSWQNPINQKNFLVNGAFDYWQAGTSTTITSTGGATPTNAYAYLADQWYANNILGGGTIEGVVTYAQAAAAAAGPNGSLFRASVKVTTAPTGTGIQNGCELWQVLSNKASLPLYGNTASLSASIVALGNVTQVGLQFFYATSEAKPTVAIGSEVLCTVNSSTWTLCVNNGQALGTSQTTAGVIGVRIRPTAVSSGHLYDVNNGFQIEQAMLNLGPVAAPFQRQYSDPAMELASCQYFYEVLNTGGSTSRVLATGACTVANTTGVFTFPFKVTKRINAAVTADAPAHFTAANAATSAAITALSDGGSGLDCGCASVTLSGTYAASSALVLSTNNSASRLFFDARI